MKLVNLFIYLLLIIPFAVQAKIVSKIGVLAYDGKEKAIQRWQPTADYLSSVISSHQFQIQALTHDELQYAISKNELDFLLTNSGHYVQLEVKSGATQIATFLTQYQQEILTQFSAVIFARKDSNIKTLQDLKGKTFAGVSKQAFGGFQIAQGVMQQQGIDPLKELDLLWLGFPQQDIVNAVWQGKADAGTVRSGILEAMDYAGKIKLSELQILNPQTHANFPLLHSAELYPEWPFAKLSNTSDILARKVAIALLQMPDDSNAATFSKGAGWTIPTGYGDVHDLFRQLQVAPYQPRPVTLERLWRNYQSWIILTTVLFVMSLFFIWRLSQNNRLLSRAQQTLVEHQNDLEKVVEKRTQELYVANEALRQDVESRIQVEELIHDGCDAMQQLYQTSIRRDLKGEQRLQSIIEVAQQFLNVEFVSLLSYENQQFKPYPDLQHFISTIEPFNLQKANEAIQSKQIVSATDLANYQRYFACPISTNDGQEYVLEFASVNASSKRQKLDDVNATSHEFISKFLKLMSYWMTHEIEHDIREKNSSIIKSKLEQRFAEITPRESDVLALLIQGESNKSMAKQLSISTKTVELHRANLLRKTQAKSSLELVKLATQFEIYSKE